ncbi:tyrosine-type recombinase/integrase [Paenibacillus aestuarii]|uniref:Tyrosine-type recombinase/integrase n=1 Tax=Paenibacillus aestuarii TaxID=516965 RepID=A0ABW0KG86_9BACL|nr:tyrosine-type recombinase/integrase [Paenibacillus aestuarii]
MRMLISDAANFFKQARYSSGTDQAYRKKFLHFAEFLAYKLALPKEKIDLERIYVLKDKNGEIVTYKPLDHRIIDEYFHTLSSTYSMLKQTRKFLSSFFRYLERNYHFKNPLLNMTFNLDDIKPTIRQSKALTRHEILKIHHVLVQQSENLVRDLLLFCLLFSTGCRRSEILSLQVWQIDYDNNSFKLVNTKNGRQRFVAMMENMGTLIKRYCILERINDKDYIFRQANEKPMTPYHLKKLLDSCCEKAGVGKFRIHGIRHSFATVLYESGVQLPLIQQLLGHQDMSITKQYIHPNYTRNYGIHIKENEELFSRIKRIYLEKN